MRMSSCVIAIGLLGLTATSRSELSHSARTDRGGEFPSQEDRRTILGIEETRFTRNGRPEFLVGISLYGALGATPEALDKDLASIKGNGFDWLRVFATWGAYGQNVSALDATGQAREPYFGRLKRLMSDCDRLGLVVDLTLARGKGEGLIPDMKAHERAVGTLITELAEHRNWYLDLANERDVRDDRFVPIEEVKALRSLARRLDPARLVTASLGGHDVSEDDLRDAFITAELDFLAPHRPRGPEAPGETEARSRECLEGMKRVGRLAPILYQEPFRRGYTNWQPEAKDFLADLRGARAGGAAGWCFHNGGERGAPEEHPRRSFDMRERGLFEQLDAVERQVVSEVSRQK
jgi:hypothetical protein